MTPWTDPHPQPSPPWEFGGFSLAQMPCSSGDKSIFAHNTIFEQHGSTRQLDNRRSRSPPWTAFGSYGQEIKLLWVPVVEDRNRSIPWSEGRQREFERVQSNMPWYSVHHPSFIHPPVIKYIKDMWHFNGKPIIVVLDRQGMVVNANALHMIWIWGITVAYPFTSSREETLWEMEYRKYSLPKQNGITTNFARWLVNDTEHEVNISNYSQLSPWSNTYIQPPYIQTPWSNTYICLYGGEDIDWIRKFTTTTTKVAQAAGITLEKMIYVGKRNSKERVKRNIDIINTEKLSYCWEDPTLIWYFWIRLESMWYSLMQHGRNPIEKDPIMKEITKMLIFDGSEQGWALIGNELGTMAEANGELILKCFNEYDMRKHSVHANKGFIQALNDHLEQVRTPHHCTRLILPRTDGRILPETMVCIDCGRPMEKSVSVSVMYSCCNPATTISSASSLRLASSTAQLLRPQPAYSLEWY
ncbi:protein SIEVE ELEMENT OCCLUSION A-like [Telopea speciosissima]|uniref:protein SIEVE ELEMENT OCCLUSION A-like n=1 Tax=Telopea speciosissima TaxID=54955 RepID=UPI001CC3726A|nr:protein SIEVE ELEMENT OCCLUSION A-like [Telopea speciosissima]